jgi:hypothetical protein
VEELEGQAAGEAGGDVGHVATTEVHSLGERGAEGDELAAGGLGGSGDAGGFGAARGPDEEHTALGVEE